MNSNTFNKLNEIVGIEDGVKLGHPLISGTTANPNKGPLSDMDLATLIVANRHVDAKNLGTNEYKLRKGLIDVTVNPYTGEPMAATTAASVLEIEASSINKKPAYFTSGNQAMDMYNLWCKRKSLEARFAMYAQNAFCNLIDLANQRTWNAIIERLDYSIQQVIRNAIWPINHGSISASIPGFFKHEIVLRYRDGLFNGNSIAYARICNGETEANLANLLDLDIYMNCHPDTICSMLLAGFAVNFDEIRTSLSGIPELYEAYDIIMDIYNYEQALLITALENNIYLLYNEARKYYLHGIPNAPAASRQELAEGVVVRAADFSEIEKAIQQADCCDCCK